MKKFKKKDLQAVKWDGTNFSDIVKEVACTQLESRLILSDNRVVEVGDYIVLFDGKITIDPEFEKYHDPI